jgi:hypothetical protein
LHGDCVKELLFMNQLQYETSPYLLQHARNPVNWYAWKPEAFEKARKENKPILVSIGYSTCHWCHVMERESFEDQEIADFMNDHFVCIKVDREERPDVDQIYMEACQVMTGGGGWPLNCFLTPDARPFYAGTYFPPMPAYNRPSWLQVLMSIADAFQNKRMVVEDQANRLTEIIQNAGDSFSQNRLTVMGGSTPFNEELLENLYQSLMRQSDKTHGGFGGAPKFPGTMSLHYLLDYQYYTNDAGALRHVELSLDKMIMGGIYDQLGGGFARYATDVKWLVPHFEKMLYDNALLVRLLAEAFKATQKPLFKETIEETLSWVAREMTTPDGAFFSAYDADSEGVEGKFYVWDKAEIETILGSDAALFCEFYGVTEHGNWEENNILWRSISYEDFARQKGIETEALKKLLKSAREKLFEVRGKRKFPGLDDKTLLDWNALMISAYARAYQAIGDPFYKDAAVRAMAFIMDKMRQADGKTLFHTWKNGKAQYDAFLDDYAFLIEAFLDVYEITFDTGYILQAKRYLEFVLENFFDAKDKLFYFTSSKQNDILYRRKDLYDSATPSGNSTMVRNLQRVGVLLGNEKYRRLATEILTKMKDSVERHPNSFGLWACAMISETKGIPEIAVLGNDAENLAASINQDFYPQKAIMASRLPRNDYPLLKDKLASEGTLIYMCQHYACAAPVKTNKELRQLLGKTSRFEQQPLDDVRR